MFCQQRRIKVAGGEEDVWLAKRTQKKCGWRSGSHLASEQKGNWSECFQVKENSWQKLDRCHKL